MNNLLLGALSREATEGFIRSEEVDREDGRARVETGEATSLLIIPERFGRAVLGEDPTALSLLTNPSQRILPGIVEEVLSIPVDGAFYLHRMVGKDLREFLGGPPEGSTHFSDERIAEFSVQVSRLVRRLSDYLDPLRIDVEAVVAGDDTPGGDVNVGVLIVPGILFMALLFMAQGLSADLWRERERMTIRRVMVSPQSLFVFLSVRPSPVFSCFSVLAL